MGVGLLYLERSSDTIRESLSGAGIENTFVQCIHLCTLLYTLYTCVAFVEPYTGPNLTLGRTKCAQKCHRVVQSILSAGVQL